MRIRSLLLPAFLAALLSLLGPVQAQSVNARNMLKLARSAADQGNWQSAKEYADKAIKDEPGYIDAIYMRAFAHRELKEYEKAIADFNAVIRQNPQYLATYGGLAETYMRQEKYDEADKVFVELSKQPDGGKWSSYYRGVVAYLQHDLDKAENFWKETLKQDVRFAPAHHNVGAISLARGDTLKALGKFREALNIEPGNTMYTFHIAWAQERLGQKAEALQTLQKVLDGAVDDKQFWLLSRGLHRLIKGENSLAVQVLKTVSEEHPDNLDVWVLLGRAHLALKQPEEARKAIETANELDPKFGEVAELMKKLPAAPSPESDAGSEG